MLMKMLKTTVVFLAFASVTLGAVSRRALAPKPERFGKKIPRKSFLCFLETIKIIIIIMKAKVCVCLLLFHTSTTKLIRLKFGL